MLSFKIRSNSGLVYKYFSNRSKYAFVRGLSGSVVENKVVKDLPVDLVSKSNLESIYLPEVPIAPDIIESTLQYNSLGEATFQSLGLNSYWPTGWVEAGFETLHVSLHLPWWGAVATAAVLTRLMMIPLTLRLRKLNANQSIIQPRLDKLEKKRKDAELINDYFTLFHATKEVQKVVSSESFRPYSILMFTVLQFPVFVSMMMALRSMAILPVESLQTGGLFWFTDLTMPDPYYILPLTTMVLFWLQIEVGADFAFNKFGNPFQRWGIRAIPVVGAIFTFNLPSALLLYWWCSSALSLIIAGVMKVPMMQRLLKTEATIVNRPTPATNSKSQPGMVQAWKQKSAEKKIYEAAKNVDFLNNENWVKAATGVVPKTFTYDPTKIKSQ